jgi:hypothetical protein
MDPASVALAVVGVIDLCYKFVCLFALGLGFPAFMVGALCTLTSSIGMETNWPSCAINTDT